LLLIGTIVGVPERALLLASGCLRAHQLMRIINRKKHLLRRLENKWQFLFVGLEPVVNVEQLCVVVIQTF